MVLLPVFFLLGTSFSPGSRKLFSLTTVVIDAGHGGHDSGCLGRYGAKEKDVALAVALKLGNYIEANFKDVKVVYTRKTDTFVELHERAAIANNANAGLFICLHCNSACYRDKIMKREICSEEAYGAESWVMGLQKSEANLEVSKRENEVVLMERDYATKYDGFDPNSPEANIIFSLYQNTYLDQSLKFASYVQQEMKTAGRIVRGVKQAGFLVLYKTTMPSVLVEMGFLTNSNEEKYMTSAKGQDELARAIYRAFKSYKYSVDGGTPSVAEAPELPARSVKEEKAPGPQTDETVSSQPESAAKQPDAGPGTVQAAAEPKQDKPAEETVTAAVPKPEKASPPARTDVTTGTVFFSVQILTSGRSLPKNSSHFKGVPVWEDQVPGMYKYCTGKLKSFKEAVSLQSEMKTKGFSGAFVVAYDGNERISVPEARKLQEGR